MPRLYGERSWQIPNELGSATAMAREALAWAQVFPISEQALYSLRLVLEELLSNTVKYGYSDPDPHTISIWISVDSDIIQVELMDDGHPFDPTGHPAPDILRHIETGVDGGFGIELVRRICRQIAYRREPHGNCLSVHIGSFDPDELPPSTPSGPKESPA
ncbi:MAG TPA: ATP-binding protein [Kiritimatiellia bacterium]|nr:ATP-binding protein [Kiritimatiellia bacterium]HPR68881.1 ATP-binding protein [Kiritimatiellia bacterium]HRX06616.1 ATP-binding protein [Kiritimatiellia bacterium]